MALKYKVGDHVRIKSLDWYNENKNNNHYIDLVRDDCYGFNFVERMAKFCGKVMTILNTNSTYYDMLEDSSEYYWTDEMIEGLVEDLLNKEIQEHQKIYDETLTIKGIESTEKVWHCPEGYQFVDENGNVINTQKIVLEKKENRYPKTYEECMRKISIDWGNKVKGYKNELLSSLQKLLICRDAYWKIAGEEMEIGRSWKPSDSDYITERYCIFVHRGNILCDTPAQDCFLTFPTEEMRDAFYENFEKLIESVKELL